MNRIGPNLPVGLFVLSNSLHNYYVLTMYFVKLSSGNTKTKEVWSLPSPELMVSEKQIWKQIIAT